MLGQAAKFEAVVGTMKMKIKASITYNRPNYTIIEYMDILRNPDCLLKLINNNYIPNDSINVTS